MKVAFDFLKIIVVSAINCSKFKS